jgi:hypothetical protein
MNSAIIPFPLIASIFGILLSPSSTYAVTSPTATNKPRSRGRLNVVVQPSMDPVVKGTQTNLKVSFDQKETSTVQPHIDYDITISKAGKQLLQASALAGRPGQRPARFGNTLPIYLCNI